MTKPPDNPFADLGRIFHEPSRLAIMSSLAGGADGMAFTQLRDDCQLTDGNLSRHLRVLEEAGAVQIAKSFVGARPRTTVFLSPGGRESFLRYLEALEAVLQRAASAAGARRGASRPRMGPGRVALDTG